MKKLLSEQLVDYLERRDTKYVFGLCGHTVIAMLDALEKSKKLKYISVRHEQIASTAADGYARATGRASVVLCHLGPGLTNATTGVANAALDSIPMVVIAGDVPSYYYGKHPHQEVNMHADASQYEIYKPFVKRAWRIDRAEMFPEILDKAFRLAESGRPGPVLISVPMDMFSREVDTRFFERTRLDSHETVKPSLDEETAKKIVKELVEAKNPVIHVGGGIILAGASEELKDFVEFLEIPVSRTLMGQGALSDRHPLMMGMTGFWGTYFINGKTSQADVILGLGTRFAEADSSSWYNGITFDANKTKFMQIDIEPSEIGRNYPVIIGAVADLKSALKVLLKVAKELYPNGVKRPEIIKAIAEYKKEFKEENKAIAEDSRFPMTPQRILKDVREVLPEDAIICTDVGWNKNGVGQQFDITQPGTIMHPGGLATMGFGSAALLGVKLAKPDKKVITLIGDGGFGTNPSVLATAKEYNIPVVWVVMNNYAFGTIAGLEGAHYKHNFGTVFKIDNKPYNPEWAEVAKAYGIKAKKIQSADEFKEAFREAIDSNEPYLLDVPMENIPVPTEGIWNINDIYTPKENVQDGVLMSGEAVRSKHVSTK
ncbi:thiamine pyrophosphate-binding protein [Fusobacterium polymorphum]|uniref:Acetohydroxyacid synthase large subunit n=1 Tax=Fusobacterium nucleatum subsp. polymorphum TaxID=76857 RepID=A0A2C6B1V3_FUSNP|nr:thiamine pyrophosphate-binding protein [Fusobacterium polymorphum]PHH99577.1 acetohydroxyacid synthase large subunit [Fusobacterium polymorphum]PIM75594.1 acetohydroxyacid synthase large subunit [Fusobacterium polymorphum]